LLDEAMAKSRSPSKIDSVLRLGNVVDDVVFDALIYDNKLVFTGGRALRLHEDKKTALIFDLVDVFNLENPKNMLYKHFLERVKMYEKRKYPYIEKIIKI
jgi:hypothetical protein